MTYYDLELQTTSPALRPPKLEGDVGFDLPTLYRTTIPRGRYAQIPTGIHVELPPNTWGLIMPRSNVNMAPGLIAKIGVIDNGFRGELLAIVENVSDTDIDVHAGESLVQLVVLPMIIPKIKLVGELSTSERNSRGFGSTGR
jgi:dUTP pyrophosphatase